MRGETGDRRAVTSIQIACFAVSLFFSCFSCAKVENCVDEDMTGNVECSQKTTEE